MSRSSRTLYVGNLPGDIREREVEDLFYKVRFQLYLFVNHFVRIEVLFPRFSLFVEAGLGVPVSLFVLRILTFALRKGLGYISASQSYELFDNRDDCSKLVPISWENL